MTEQARTILRVSGNDAASFLQGLVTNDVNRLKTGIVYAAMLTPQGKYLADFFLVPDGSDILIDVASPLAAGLFQRLSMYKLRADVTLVQTDQTVARGPLPVPDGAFADPRHAAMGWRAYDGRPDAPGIDWTALRVANCIPESGIELTPDTFILEAGFEALNGVDFRKGCYVGQEVTARMKHKTELRKGLARVSISDEVPIGTTIMAGDKEAGQVFSQSNGEGIAYLRFDRATGALSAELSSVEKL
ncbi:CAF17-like 4Fe-4S cluster assembly/insertion protein YgfZ [Pseudoprimorskyibacter insulae]|uniref:tRNA-modifying protein YgfZ n=1 Tax=Pseudoprimorskyibacter insulae TaxID=1695997 RepID=A0A2R8B0U6_9RHOB|nr:folate-binding protein YgfZ [Pseudoprimorskyibacter insulae]SPF81915.1 tRNA-modifying protein YgfZ [Pseudoprimorskyibacter insulae]